MSLNNKNNLPPRPDQAQPALNKSEQWKAPVSVWIRGIQEERKNKSLQKQKRKAAAQNDV